MVNHAEVIVVTNARKETEPLTDVYQVPKMEIAGAAEPRSALMEFRGGFGRGKA